MENDSSSNAFNFITRLLLPTLSVVALVAAIWRMFAPNQETLNRLDERTILYLGVAGVLLLLRDVKSLAFGDYKVEFDRIRGIAADAQNKAENAQSVALGTGKIDETAPMLPASTTGVTPGQTLSPGHIPGDPWKGVFGDKSAVNNRLITAEVSTVPGSKDLFSIGLKISSTRPKDDPLTGFVQFFLHNTFKNDRPIIKVGPNGSAELKLTAWGAFTVGALCDDGKTRLELDLATLEDAPSDFRNR